MKNSSGPRSEISGMPHAMGRRGEIDFIIKYKILPLTEVKEEPLQLLYCKVLNCNW